MVAKGGPPGNGRAVVYRTEVASPIGPLGLYATNLGLMAVVFPRHSRVAVEAWLQRVIGEARIVDDAEVLEDAIGQLGEYFAGARRQFDLALDVRGTAFQCRVWEAVAAVPFGQTRSYADVARTVGNAKAVRSVGAANGAKPLEIANLSIEQIADRFTARFRDRNADWDAFADARIEGYKRAQHRFIGAGGSGKHGDPNVIPPGNFTLSIMYVEPGQGNAAHTHEVEEVFFVLKGLLTIFLEDEAGNRIETRLGQWE